MPQFPNGDDRALIFAFLTPRELLVVLPLVSKEFRSTVTSVAHAWPRQIVLQYLYHFPGAPTVLPWQSVRFLDLSGSYAYILKNLLAQCGQQGQLQRLDLRGVRGLSGEELRHVAQHLGLMHLVLSKCKSIGDDGIAELRSLPLQRLELDSCELSDDALRHLRGMPLTYLSLSVNHAITAAGLTSLAGLPITFLDLSYCNGVGNGLQALSGLRQLRTLKLGGYSVTDQSIADLRNALLSLQSLSLKGPASVTSVGYAHVAAMGLLRLSLNNMGLESSDCRAIILSTSIRELAIKRSRTITGEELARFSAMPLAVLIISKCDHITQEDFGSWRGKQTEIKFEEGYNSPFDELVLVLRAFSVWNFLCNGN